MNSLPDQHIDSLPEGPRREAYEKVTLLWAARMHGSTSEEELVKKAKFPSIAAMHASLKNWGLTGMLPVHHEDQTEQPKRRARRSGGEKRELPPAVAAVELLRGALLRLEHDVAELHRRREYIQDERFVVERHFSGDARESYKTHHRGEMPDSAWREFCEAHGADPGQDSFTVWEDSIVSGGVSWAPPEPLTRLIAVYILAGEPLEPLLRALHDDPEAVDKKKLDEHIRGRKVGKDKIPGLLHRAEQVAHLVRGGTWRRGTRTPNLSRREEEAAAYIQFQRNGGVSDEKILQELRDGYGFTKPAGLFADPEEYSWPDMKMDDLKRLGDFQLPSIFGDRP